MAEHTELPWRVSEFNARLICGGPDDRVLADMSSLRAEIPENTANAAFIVKACNNFEQMLAALQMVQGMDIDPVIQRAIDNVVKQATTATVASADGGTTT